MAAGRPLDVVVWGSTGFTGKLVVEHLVRDYSSTVKFAIAGRNKQKLEQLRAELAATYSKPDIITNVPILTASLDDAASMDAITSQSTVVISTAGPFAQIGKPVVASAVRSGTNYVDITGETAFVKEMIDLHHQEAAAKGIKVVSCCGYDSIPSDLGALLVVEKLKDLGKNVEKVVSVVMEGKGGVSGGTIASGLYMTEDLKKKGVDPATLTVYDLVPEKSAKGTDKEFWSVEYNKEVQRWLGPFIMQVCNNRVVHRSNYLSKWGGVDFKYQESMAAGSWTSARLLCVATIGAGLALSKSFLHPLIKRIVPKQGEGPSREAMLGGHYKHTVLGYSTKDAAGEQTVVVGEVEDPNRDPGYWGTSRLVLEAALCLALNQDALKADTTLIQGGVLTPATAMGDTLINRLRAAGIKFEITDTRQIGGGSV